MGAVKMKAPNGATVSVDSSRVDNLLSRGFTQADEPKKAPAKKAAVKKSESAESDK